MKKMRKIARQCSKDWKWLKGGEDIARKKEVRAALFDMDGVISDSYDAWAKVINDARVSIGRSALDKKTLRKHFGAPVEKDAKTHFKGLTVDQIRGLYLKFFWKRKHLIKEMPNARKVLGELKKRNIKMALISNSTEEIIRFTLKKFKIRKHFGAVLSMDDVKKRKPHPQMVLKACKKLGVHPSEAIVIGHTKNDMLAGKRAGCATIGFKVKGDHTISSLSSILEII